jgi:tetratricopeptide (TPR) repeat protein
VRLETLGAPLDKSLARASEEFIEAMRARGDDYASHYNLGNFYLEGRRYEQALASYQIAARLRPDFVPTHVNAAFAYHAAGHSDQALASFRKATELDPNGFPAWLNLGMLLGEESRPREAEQAFRQALRLDPNSAVAAYNLGVLLATDRVQAGLPWCRKAYNLRPDVPKYGYTYAFYLTQTGGQSDAIKVLSDLVNRRAVYADAYALLGTIYQRQGRFEQAAQVYQAAADNEALPMAERASFRAMAEKLR